MTQRLKKIVLLTNFGKFRGVNGASRMKGCCSDCSASYLIAGSSINMYCIKSTATSGNLMESNRH